MPIFQTTQGHLPVFENISAIQEWVKKLKNMDSSQASDSFIADCILQLLKENPDERMPAVKLYNRISSYQDLEKRK